MNWHCFKIYILQYKSRKTASTGEFPGVIEKCGECRGTISPEVIIMSNGNKKIGGNPGPVKHERITQAEQKKDGKQIHIFEIKMDRN